VWNVGWGQLGDGQSFAGDVHQHRGKKDRPESISSLRHESR